MKHFLRCFFFMWSILAIPCARVSIVEINVSKYEGLKSLRLSDREKRNQFYNFQFCLCPHDVELQSQISGSPKCECSSLKKGKRVIDSTPSAVFPLSCYSKPLQQTCLAASFSKEWNERLFVKVAVGNVIVTQPLWQEIAVVNSKTTQSLKTFEGTPLRISYLFTRLIAPKNEVSKSALKSKSVKSGPISNALHIKKDNNLIYGHSQSEKTRFTKAIQSLPIRTKDEISSVAMYTTIDQIRLYLLQESLRDRIPPLRFDVWTFKNQLTAYHNIFRRRHGAPPLYYDIGLEGAAQNWANYLGARRSCLIHEVPRRFGENLFYFGARNFPSAAKMAHLVTQSFYMEGVGYDYNRFYPMTYYKTGHFTQLVWRSSQRIGVGVSIVAHDGKIRAPCQAGVPLYMIYVVVKYDPAGNFQSNDAYLNNVRPPIYG